MLCQWCTFSLVSVHGPSRFWKTDCSIPHQDFGLIEIQLRWSRVPLFWWCHDKPVIVFSPNSSLRSTQNTDVLRQLGVKQVWITKFNLPCFAHNHGFCCLQVWCPIVFASLGLCWLCPVKIVSRTLCCIRCLKKRKKKVQYCYVSWLPQDISDVMDGIWCLPSTCTLHCIYDVAMLLYLYTSFTEEKEDFNQNLTRLKKKPCHGMFFLFSFTLCILIFFLGMFPGCC